MNPLKKMIKTLVVLLLALLVLNACENPLLDEIEILRTRAYSPKLVLALADGTSLTPDDTLDYGTVSVGSFFDISITVKNSGNSSLTLGAESILLTMGNTTEDNTFTLITSPAADIPVGETSTLTLRFSPVSEGVKSAALSIPSNDFNKPVFTLPITGTGWKAVLSTTGVTNIEMTTATGGGNITDDGGIPITERGICWAETINPTVDNNRIKDSGSGTGSYSVLMTGLSAGTFYYVRAYATNGAITVYGPQVSFTTKPAAPSISSAAAVPYEAGSGKLALSWTSANGPSTYYDVYYSTTNTPPGSPNGPTDLTAASCILTGLTNYTDYYVWIQAKNSSGTSALSASGTAMVGIKVTSFTLDKTPKAFLTGAIEAITVTVEPSTATNPVINWTSSNNARATVSGGVITPGSTAGNVTITAAAADGFGPSVNFTAQNHANGTIGTSLSPGPAGGTVFYDKGSYSGGWRYLEVDASLRGYGLAWHNGTNLDITGANNSGIGTGKENTDAIIAAQGEGAYMAMDCRGFIKNGYSDWYMPSRDEVTEIIADFPGILAGMYDFASSTQYDSGRNLVYYYSTGAWNTTFKYWTSSITCPVRRF